MTTLVVGATGATGQRLVEVAGSRAAGQGNPALA